MTCEHPDFVFIDHEGHNTRAVPDVPELETVGHLWEYAEYYREERGYYGYVKIITEENPSTHVSPASKIRHHRELVTRDQAAEIIAADRATLEQAKKEINTLLVSYVREHFFENKTFQPLDSLIGQISQLDNAITITRDFKNRAEAVEAELAQIKAQEPVKGAALIDGQPALISRTKPLPKGATPLYASPAPCPDLKAENEKLREALRKAHASLEIDRTGRFEEFKNIINLALDGDANA